MTSIRSKRIEGRVPDAAIANLGPDGLKAHLERRLDTVEAVRQPIPLPVRESRIKTTGGNSPPSCMTSRYSATTEALISSRAWHSRSRMMAAIGTFTHDDF